MVHHADRRDSACDRFVAGAFIRLPIIELLDFRGVSHVCGCGCVLVTRGVAANPNGENAAIRSCNCNPATTPLLGICSTLGIIGHPCICGDVGGVLLDGGKTCFVKIKQLMLFQLINFQLISVTVNRVKLQVRNFVQL